MADIVARLLLDTSGFDANLNKAMQNTKGYKENVGSLASVMSKGMMRVAGAFGVAMGSMEAINKTIASSQTLTDDWGRTVEAATSITDSFFDALSHGDFSSFISGIGEAISKAKEYYNIIDDLGTFDIFHSSTIASEQLKITEAKIIINNKQSSAADKAKAAKAIKDSEAVIEAENKKLGIKASDAYYAGVRKVLANNGGIKASNKWIDTYFSYDGLEKAKKTLNELTNKHSIIDHNGNKQFTGWGKNEATAKGFKAILELSDKATQKIIRYKEQAIAAKQATANMELSNVRALNKANVGSSRGSGAKENKELSPEESIAYYNQELTKANREFNSAVSESARAAIQQKIDELKEVIRVMQFKADHPILPKDAMASMTSKTSLKQSANPGLGLKIQPLYTKKDVAITNDYAGALNATANAMSTLNTAMGDGNNTFLSFAAISGGAIAQMIIQLQALAGAKGIAGAFSMPFPASLAAVASVVSTVASVFASLPKFAEGGIVQGASSFGDMNIARVNSGEMILNGSQQANLFKMLNKGNVGSTTQKLDGTIKVKGSDLYLILSNYMSKLNKIR